MREPLLHRFLTGALLATLGATALVLGAPRIELARADAAQVTVVGPGSAQQTISLDALAGQEDVRARAYALRSAGGEEAETVTGFSLAAVLSSAGADPYGFSYLEVQRPAGGAVVLSRHQALDADAFPEGPPTVYATATGTGFLRPSSGGDDLNADDSFESPQGLTVSLRKGEPLRVRARASRLRVRPGQKVSFEALVDRAGSGEELGFSWYFDDGGSATGANATHSFSRRGSYDVVVGVTTPGDRAGASAVVTIQVGKPLPGPDRKGGGRRSGGDAPDHGSAGNAGGASPPGPASPTATGSPAPTMPAAPVPAPRSDRESTPSRPAGTQVSGRLVSAPRTTPLQPSPAPAPGARSGRLSESGTGSGLPGTTAGVLLTLALLGTGALVELRGAFPPLWGRKGAAGELR